MAVVVSALCVNSATFVDYPTPTHPGVVNERVAQTWKANRRECAKSFRAVPLRDGGFDAAGRLFSLSCVCEGSDAPVVKKSIYHWLFFWSSSNNGGRWGSCFIGHATLGLSAAHKTRIRRVWGVFSDTVE